MAQREDSPEMLDGLEALNDKIDSWNAVPLTVKQPRRIFVVCTNPETNEHIAFDPTNPDIVVRSHMEETALAGFVLSHCPEIEVVFVNR